MKHARSSDPVTVGTAAEREVLASFLDFHRGVVVRKVADLSSPVARGRLIPSDTTLAGLLRHLAVTERQWFQQVLSGHPAPAGEGAEDPDTSWVVTEDETVEGLVQQYELECERSRAAAAGLDRDYAVPHPAWDTCRCAGSMCT